MRDFCILLGICIMGQMCKKKPKATKKEKKKKKRTTEIKLWNFHVYAQNRNAFANILQPVQLSQLVNWVCSFRMLLDSSLVPNCYIIASASNAFCHLQLDRRLCPILVDDDLASLIRAFVTFWLHKSNAIYLDRKPAALGKHQLVQNAAIWATASSSSLSSAFYTGFL